MYHIMEGDWAITSERLIIPIRKVVDWINYKNISSTELDIDLIAHKELPDPLCIRYHVASLNYPGIVVEGMKNPLSKPYRLIDGRHRLLKAINNGDKEFSVYVLQQSEVERFYTKG